ncbi:MAG: UDP-N-acetylmuramate--L-alanine ligase [Clostridia bacterium]|nr:UDP-N-acetylmuramate--L-alanine ligase [Clostridia bacterium]
MRIYLIGIGGVSMSGIAQMLLKEGCVVSGSDGSSSPLTEKLEQAGIKVFIGHDADNVKDCDLVVYSAAIREDNPERVRAKELGIKQIDRAQMLGMIMKEYDCPIAVSGTHGKTTTSGMLTHIFMECGKNPTVTVGGELDIIRGNVHLGDKKYFIAEACEYHQSFLRFFPKISIITNIEADHLDYFKDLDHIIDTFRSLALLTPTDGALIVNGEDKNIAKALSEVDRKIITFGMRGDFDYTIDNLSPNGFNHYTFTVCKKGNPVGEIRLSVPGIHNVYDALAAFAAADYLGIGADDICDSLYRFGGTHRRFETRGIMGGILVVDDYAHHPTEIAATLAAARDMKFNNIWCLFQPHTYTRTKAFFDDFVKVLSQSNANIIVTDIYAARETDTGIVSALQLANAIPNAVYKKTFAEAAEFIKSQARRGDIVITMGAGDVYKVGDILLSHNE